VEKAGDEEVKVQ